MRYGVLPSLVLVLASCQVDYEDNERLLIQGSVDDSVETPIPDLTINVYPSNGGSFVGSNETIGTGKTLSDGSFSVVSLSPKTPSNLRITVNENLRQGYRPEYSSETINNVELLENRNHTYILPKIILNKTSESSLSVKIWNTAKEGS